MTPREEKQEPLPAPGIRNMRVTPSLRRKIALNLAIQDGEVGELPFIPVVVIADLDAEPGPSFDPIGDGAAQQVVQVDLTVANATPLKIFPEETPLSRIWIDALSVGAVCQLIVGQGREFFTVNTNGLSWDFDDVPSRSGVYLLNTVQPVGSIVRVGFKLGKNLRARAKA